MENHSASNEDSVEAIQPTSSLLKTEPSPFYDTSLFTELKYLEDNWEVILSEIPAFDQSKVQHTRPLYGFTDENGREFLR